MHFLVSGPSLFAFSFHILGNFTAALWWLVQVFPLIKKRCLPIHKGLILCISLPEASRWYVQKQVRATRNTRGQAPNQNLQPAGDQVAALTLADVTTVYFSVTNRIKSSGTNRPTPWLFLWVYWLSVYTHCRVANFHVFIWCVSGWGWRGGVVFAPASSCTDDLNVIKIIN